MSSVDYRILSIKLNNFNEARDGIEKEVKDFITNHHFPVDERWSMLLKTGFGKTGWYEDFESLNKLLGRQVDWKKDFGLQRHHIVPIENIYKDLLERGFSKEQLKDFQNEVTVKYIRSFKYDW